MHFDTNRALLRVQPDLIARKLLQDKTYPADVDTNFCLEGMLLVCAVFRLPLKRIEDKGPSIEANSPSGDLDKVHEDQILITRGSRRVHGRNFWWRLSLPPWLASKTLEIAGEKLQHGWQWVFRSYNVIPANSEVVSLTIGGNIGGLQRLFASRKASPFDRTDRWGFTLLHVSTDDAWNW